MNIVNLFKWRRKAGASCIGNGGAVDEEVVRKVLPEFGEAFLRAQIGLVLGEKRTGAAALEGIITVLDKGFDLRRILFLVDRDIRMKLSIGFQSHSTCSCCGYYCLQMISSRSTSASM